MTPEEKHLYYDFLKRLPFTVRRQKNIGNFIVDFYIPKKQLIIELDGSQHFEPEHKLADEKRDQELSKLNITVVRYTNKNIHESFQGVCDDILNKIGLTWDDLK